MAYDVGKAFDRIENELFESMMRNFERHKVAQAKEGMTWDMWQALQLQELDRYRKENLAKYQKEFAKINAETGAQLQASASDGYTAEDKKLAEQVKKGNINPANVKDDTFARINDGRLNAMIGATTADFNRAEFALLRKADDMYRHIIFDAAMYNSVTGDYNKAIDMATKDYLKNGIQCIQYRNGAMHNIQSYAEMAIRTNSKRAYLMGEGNAHDKYGIHTVRVNKRTNACPKCVRFLGKVLVDDVYSGGNYKEAAALGVPTLSQAMAEGFLHPNCKDVYSLYIEGVSRPADTWTQEEITEIVDNYTQEQELKHAEDMADSYARMAKFSLDPANKQAYQQRADDWTERAAELKGEPINPIESVEPKPPTIETSKAEAFVAAETLEDAEKYAKRFVDTERFAAIGISYDGVSIEIANEVNKTIGTFFDTFNVEPFGGILAPKGNTKFGKLIGDSVAGYLPVRHSFLLNRKDLKDFATANKYFKTQAAVVEKFIEHPEKYDKSKMNKRVLAVLEKSKISGRGTVPMTVEEAIWHELGHSLEKPLRKVDNYEILKGNWKKFAPNISGYACDSFEEYIAESFCSYQKGENIADPEIIKAFEMLKKK